MNTDIESYEFADPDLEAAVGKLDKLHRAIIILHLMGYTQWEIAGFLGCSKSKISDHFIIAKKNIGKKLFLTPYKGCRE